MSRRPAVSALASAGLVLSLLIAGGFAVLLNVDEVTILTHGCVVVEESQGGIVVRATSLTPSVELRCRDNLLGTPFTVRFENVDGLSVHVSSSASSPSTTRESGAAVVETQVRGSVTLSVKPDPPADEDFSFLVIGDTQGRAEVVDAMLADAWADPPLFAIHTGDMTSQGAEGQLDEVVARFSDAGIPLFATPGNHDMKSGGSEMMDAVAPKLNRFAWGDIGFVSFATGPEGLVDVNASEVRDALGAAGLHHDRVVAFTHVPPFEPSGIEHSYLDTDDSATVRALLDDNGVGTLFCGHIHLYNHTALDSIDAYVTGGGGAALYSPPEEGGFHHYLRVQVSGSGIDVEPVPIQGTIATPQAILLINGGRRTVLDLEECEGLATVSGQSSVENQYGNVRGNGTYAGYMLSDLVSLAGGMSPSQSVRVTASDGYAVTLGFGNVHPDATLLPLQGQFILATSFDGQSVPYWEDGPRLVCLPADGLFSNADAEAVAPPGVDPPVSAGSLWVRYVASIEVVG